MADGTPGSPVKAVLEGGPEEIPGHLRSRLVLPPDSKIKIPHHGGYEHFELADELADASGSAPAVFRWTMRTEVAE